jgi:phage tail-like protein
MVKDSGFLNLNVGGQWPSFDLHDLEIAADGALRLVKSGANFVPYGSALGGPFTTALATAAWFRLHATDASVPDGAHAQLFTFTGAGGPPPYTPGSPAPFTAPGWSPIPRDLLDGIVSNPAAPQLWVGLLFTGTATATPELSQIRVDYGRDTYLSFLPPLYAQNAASRDFLERLLALAASELGGIEDEIEDLPLLFDARSSPAPDWLQWLAGWLDFRMSARWPQAKARHYLREAFELYNWRGTVRGLERMLKMYAGVNARIWEPARYTSLWSLGEVSTLGATTMLAPSPLEGAVLGSTAEFGLSRVTGDDSGAMLFEDIANRFCVEVYCSDLRQPGAMQAVRALLDREKPAHTVYTLSTVEPAMSIGWQAIVGVDAIVGGGIPLRLGQRVGAPLSAAPLPSSTNPPAIERSAE